MLTVANIKSAKKRIDTINRRREENKFVKATLSTYIKNFRKALAEGRTQDAEAKLPEIIAYIDSACSKGVIHANNASRKVGRLSAALFKAKATVVEAPTKTTKKVEKVEVEATEVVAEEKPAKAKKTTAKAEKTEKAVKEKKTTTKKTKKVEE